MDNFQRVQEAITAHIPDSTVEITDLTGTQDHLGLLVTSSSFAGKMLIEQHQMVMDALRDELKERIHAVQIKTIVKES